MKINQNNHCVWSGGLLSSDFIIDFWFYESQCAWDLPSYCTCMHFLDTLSILEWIGRYITHFGTRLFICHTAPLSQMMSHSEPDGVSLWHFKNTSGRDDGDLLSPAVIMDAHLKLQIVRFGGHAHMEPCQCDNKVFKLRGSGLTKLSDLVVFSVTNILYIHVTRILSL